jgi:D-3-phosphoglycerate dehydrogenase
MRPMIRRNGFGGIKFRGPGYCATAEEDMMDKIKPVSIFVSTTPFGEHDRAPIEWLAAAGWNVRVNDTGRKLTPAEVAGQGRDCDGIIAGTEDLNPLLDANDRLRIISRVGVGLDSVPLKRCKQRNIAVAYTPDAVTPAVAEFTVGAMISACRHISGVDRQLRRGQWHRAQGLRIGEAKIGIIGFGRIGSSVGRLLAGFNPIEILVCDIIDRRVEIAELSARGVRARASSIEEILDACDVVSLHVPLTHSTRGMIGAKELLRMPNGAFLVNTSRGCIVDEGALFDAVQTGHLAGAAMDVFEKEPYTGPLRQLDNVLLTAHIASCSVDCRAKMECDATAEVIRFFNSEPLKCPVPDDEYKNHA